ncbi:unnamed protein product [Timema podura]|uniref:Uncharacterized protein n=1 Tax=Timema podura TaxID=61482 RepID=A0ABN7PES0_TIMPD|nr:unnamed protein product [Timema podura]
MGTFGDPGVDVRAIEGGPSGEVLLGRLQGLLSVDLARAAAIVHPVRSPGKTQESRRRKAKNWEEDDFYDSDEDTYFDRTGNVENKRQRRMKAAGKVTSETETYDTLVCFESYDRPSKPTKKHDMILAEIKAVESKLTALKKPAKLQAENIDDDDDDSDPLDKYINDISSGIQDEKKLKVQLEGLKTEEQRLYTLIKIATPASFPNQSIQK